MAATITIDADTRGAERGLDRINGRLDDLRREMQRTDQATPGLGAARIAAASTAFMAAGTAIQGIGMAAQFARDRVQAFFESSAEGKQVWEQIDMQFKSASGAIGELILGTNDVGEAGELVRDVMGDVVAIIRGFGAAVEPLIGLLRTGLVTALDAVAKAFGDQEEAARQAAEAIDAVRIANDELEQASMTVQERAAAGLRLETDREAAALAMVETLEREAEAIAELGRVMTFHTNAAEGMRSGYDTVGASAEQMEEIHSALVDRLFTMLLNQEDLNQQIVVYSDVLGRGTGATRTARLVIDNAADALRGLTTVFAEGGEEVNLFQQLTGLLTISTEDLAGAQADAGRNTRNTNDALREQTEAIRELTKAQLAAKNITREGLEQTQRTEAAITDLRQRQIDSAIEAYNEARALEEEQQREINAIAERAAQERLAIQAEEHRQQQAADAAAQAARQSIFASVGGAMAGLIQAEGDAMTRVRKVLGQELVARGQAALAQAAIMAATLNPAAAGVAAAGLGAIALGKRFGAGGGGMGAGRGGGGGGRSATVTQNITFAGGAAGQDTRAIAAAIGRASRDGVLEGMA